MSTPTISTTHFEALDAPHRDLKQARTWFFLLHAVTMMVTFLGIFALGILYGRFGRTFLPTKWFRYHRAIQITGVVSMVIAAISAIIAVQLAGAPHFKLLHQKVGLAVIVLVLLQAAGGQAGHIIRQRHGLRAQNALHVGLGLVIFGLAAWNVQLGLDIWGWKPAPVWKTIMGAWSIFLAVVYVGGLTLWPSQRREELSRAAGGEGEPLLR